MVVAILMPMDIHYVVVTAKACSNIPVITGENFLDIKANIPGKSEGNEEMARDNATHFRGIFLQLLL